MSRTSVKSRRVVVVPTSRTGGPRPFSISAICRATSLQTKPSPCRGPTWLKARTITSGSPSERA